MIHNEGLRIHVCGTRCLARTTLNPSRSLAPSARAFSMETDNVSCSSKLCTTYIHTYITDAANRNYAYIHVCMYVYLSVSFTLDFESWAGRSESLRILSEPKERHGARRYATDCRPTCMYVCIYEWVNVRTQWMNALMYVCMHQNNKFLYRSNASGMPYSVRTALEGWLHWPSMWYM